MKCGWGNEAMWTWRANHAWCMYRLVISKRWMAQFSLGCFAFFSHRHADAATICHKSLSSLFPDFCLLSSLSQSHLSCCHPYIPQLIKSYLIIYGLDYIFHFYRSSRYYIYSTYKKIKIYFYFVLKSFIYLLFSNNIELIVIQLYYLLKIFCSNLKPMTKYFEENCLNHYIKVNFIYPQKRFLVQILNIRFHVRT